MTGIGMIRLSVLAVSHTEKDKTEREAGSMRGVQASR
jgi:hypothetical protein